MARRSDWAWLAVLLGHAVVTLLLAWLGLQAAMTPAWGAEVFAPEPPAAALRWRSELTRAAHMAWGLDAPVAAMAAQIHQESGWNAAAVSRVGAQGMAQFMPQTARWWCSSTGVAAADCQPTNPRWALRALAGYNRHLWDQLAAAAEPYAQDPQAARGARLWATLRAYNGGIGHWLAEARIAAGPRRAQVDAACGRTRRSAAACRENLAYPHRILTTLQPRYEGWGEVWVPPAE